MSTNSDCPLNIKIHGIFMPLSFPWLTAFSVTQTLYPWKLLASKKLKIVFANRPLFPFTKTTTTTTEFLWPITATANLSFLLVGSMRACKTLFSCDVKIILYWWKPNINHFTSNSFLTNFSMLLFQWNEWEKAITRTSLVCFIRLYRKNHTHVRKVGHTSEFLFCIYWWTWKTSNY